MKTKQEIKDALDKCIKTIDNKSLELEDWAHLEGQKKVLTWMLEEDAHLMKITAGANDRTIKAAQERLSNECGFGLPDGYD